MTKAGQKLLLQNLYSAQIQASSSQRRWNCRRNEQLICSRSFCNTLCSKTRSVL